jgi:hypothetical protein
MKKTLCLIIIFSFLTGVVRLHAQAEADSTRFLLSEETLITGFGAPFVDFSAVNSEFAVCLGGGAAMMFNQTAFIGGYFEGIMTNHYRPDLQTIVDENNPKISFEHGGIWLGYIHKHQKAIHGGLSLKLGWGEIDLKDDGNGNPESDYDYRDRIFTAVPQVEVELNMSKWFKINIGAGYRFVTGIDAEYTDDEGIVKTFYNSSDFNSPVGTVTLIFCGSGKKK